MRTSTWAWLPVAAIATSATYFAPEVWSRRRSPSHRRAAEMVVALHRQHSYQGFGGWQQSLIHAKPGRGGQQQEQQRLSGGPAPQRSKNSVNGCVSFVIFSVGTDCALMSEDERPRKKMQAQPFFGARILPAVLGVPAFMRAIHAATNDAFFPKLGERAGYVGRRRTAPWRPCRPMPQLFQARSPTKRRRSWRA